MSNSKQGFEGLLTRYFERLLEADPVFATATAGLASGEGKLGSLGQRFHDGQERKRRQTLTDLEGHSPRELSREQQLDRLALRSKLLKESEEYARGRPALEPNAPEQVLGILFHELRRAQQEPRRAAANLRALLRQAPDFLAEAGEVLRKPEPVWLRVMEQTVAGGAVLLQGVGSFLAKHGEAANDAAAISAVQKAMERYRERAQRLPAAAPGSFAIGATALQRRVHDELGLDYTLGEIESLAWSEVGRVRELLEAACARFGRKRSAAQVIADARCAWRPDQPLLQLYQQETRRIAQGFRAARAVGFPQGETLEVRPVPEYLRALIPTAAYSQPPAFARKQQGIFWVNDLSELKQTQAEKLKEQQQHFGIPLTCAHEAYPGHHLQFVTANGHPRKWRRLFAHAVFYEGWTLWCEQMMVDLKIDRSRWLPVQQLHDALWRCHRILVDLHLQTGRYTYQQAVRHLQKHVGFTRARAEADVNWYTAQPAVPMS